MQSDFTHFYQLHEQDLRAFVAAVVRCPQARLDVVQEISETLWQKFEEFDPARASFGAWARGIAKLKLLEFHRRQAKFPLLFSPETMESIFQGFAAEDQGEPDRQEQALELCMGSLPEKSRTLLHLRYHEGLACERIGKQLGANVKAIHQALCRLRYKLEECIHRRLENDDFTPAPFTTPCQNQTR
jgi:RNA polymerase sigma-70 factor, ECF subfamily